MMPPFWMQTTHLFPRYPLTGIPAWCQYWITSQDVRFPNLTFNQKNAINAWWSTIVSNFCEVENLIHTYTNFWCFASNLYTYDFGGVQGVYGVGFPLPQSQAAVVQRWTSTAGRSGRGRGYLCQIPRGQVAGSILLEPYRSNLEAAFNSWIGPVTVDGVDFTPALPSYKNVKLLPITKHTIAPRLGVVHRRAREPILSGSPNTPRTWPQ